MVVAMNSTQTAATYTDEQLERMEAREHAYRMTIARLLDAVERYPEDLRGATEQARDEMRRQPLWCEIDEQQERSSVR
jgi:hypothetical protein